MGNKNRTARFELMLIAFVALTFAVLELYIASFTSLVIWSAQNESLLITEVVTLAIVLAIGLSVYSWRRWREAVALEADKMRLQQTVSNEKDAKLLMRSYADAVTRGQEAERRRLARELHDDTVQRLILLNQKLELAILDYESSPAAKDIAAMQTVVNDTICNVRQFIQALRPTYLDELGLVAALSTLIKETRERSELLIEFDVSGKRRRLDEATELALYRITQSALSNALQHADALTIKVTLDFRADDVLLSIEDDGIGFVFTDEIDLAGQGHFGLIGMRERAELVGACYKLHSAPNAGTRITVVAPITTRSVDCGDATTVGPPQTLARTAALSATSVQAAG